MYLKIYGYRSMDVPETRRMKVTDSFMEETMSFFVLCLHCVALCVVCVGFAGKHREFIDI